MNPLLLRIFGQSVLPSTGSGIIGGSFLVNEKNSSFIPSDYELSKYFDNTVDFLNQYTTSGLFGGFAQDALSLVDVLSKSEETVDTAIADTVQDKEDIVNSVGETLPEILKNNAVGSVSAMGTYTKTISKGFSDINLSLGLIATIMQESLKLKAIEVASLDPAASLAPTVNVQSASPAINVSPAVNVQSATPAINVSSTAPIVNVSSAVPDITVQSAAPNVEVNPVLGLPVTLEGNLNDVLGLQKKSIPKQITKDDLKIESLEYTKTNKDITDLDGQVMANVSPREVANIKNVSDARVGTDTNNFELDDYDFDIMDMIPDLSSMFEHTTWGSDLEKIFRNQE